MPELPYRTALVIGAGPGISASFARLAAGRGLHVGLAARDTGKLATLAAETGARLYRVEAAVPDEVAHLFEQAEAELGGIDVVLYNASARVRGTLDALDPEAVRQSLEISAFGGFLAVREAARRMIPRAHGAILLTGATASVKGFAGSAAFAMGKFALRGLAQSAARELAPQGIHVAHFVIDGGVRSASRPDPQGTPDSTLDPDAIAASYLDALSQHRSAWSWESELRPWTERF